MREQRARGRFGYVKIIRVADKEVDRLFALPLEEFTAARNELAKARGDAELRKLKKPTIAAWAVNQLVREREVDVRRLLRAGERLEAAQKEAVQGGEQRPFEEARREERDAVRRLRTAAAELLRAGGHPASDATLERVAGTLHAAAATSAGRETLREGRLSEELEPAGFDVLAGLAATPPRKKAGAQKRPTADDRRRARKARTEADEAEREAREAAARVTEAERAVRNAERELAKARRTAEQAADRAERLAAKASELEAPL
jgi:hypothetical protein